MTIRLVNSGNKSGWHLNKAALEHQATTCLNNPNLIICQKTLTTKPISPNLWTFLKQISQKLIIIKRRWIWNKINPTAMSLQKIIKKWKRTLSRKSRSIMELKMAMVAILIRIRAICWIIMRVTTSTTKWSNYLTKSKKEARKIWKFFTKKVVWKINSILLVPNSPIKCSMSSKWSQVSKSTPEPITNSIKYKVINLVLSKVVLVWGTSLQKYQ